MKTLKSNTKQTRKDNDLKPFDILKKVNTIFKRVKAKNQVYTTLKKTHFSENQRENTDENTLKAPGLKLFNFQVSH